MRTTASSRRTWYASATPRFSVLYRPDIPATNWAAEQEIRPAVVTRKVCGGNRTWRGAHMQQVIASVLRTCAQQSRECYALPRQIALRAQMGLPAEQAIAPRLESE